MTMSFEPKPGSTSATPENPALIMDSSTATFQADVLEASLEVPVFVDFWAPWCGPCRQLTPAIEKVVNSHNGKIRLVKINVDENQALAGQMGVQSIPAVFGFVGGRPIDGFMGAQPESEINNFAQRLIDAAAQAGIGAKDSLESQIEEALEAASQAIAAQDLATAQKIYTSILQHMPENIPALVGMAKIFADAGDLEGAEACLEMLPPKTKSPEADSIRTAIALAREANSLGNPDAFLTRLNQNPDDHEARFDLAMILNARGEKTAAVEALIEIMRRDREWKDDGARLKLLEFFEAWGFKDEATIKGRRLLSALLFR